MVLGKKVGGVDAGKGMWTRILLPALFLQRVVWGDGDGTGVRFKLGVITTKEGLQ